MPITRAHVVQARALWTVLAPEWQARLDAAHRDMEKADDWATIRALQGEAHTYREFLGLPDRLDALVTLDEQAAREARPQEAQHGMG